MSDNKILFRLLIIFLYAKYLAYLFDFNFDEVKKWIKKTYKKIVLFLELQFYAMRGEKYHEEIVWKKLKEAFDIATFEYEVRENEKAIYTNLNLAPNYLGRFWYMMHAEKLYLRAAIIPNYPVDDTTNIFILAQHFNNQLKHGTVVVYVRLNYIEFRTTYHFPEIIFKPDYINWHIDKHLNVAQDIFWAFNKMLTENEEPAYIIAELIAKREIELAESEAMAEN